MVSKTLSYISKIWGIISGAFLILIAIFQDEIKNLITSTLGVSNEAFVFYAIIVLLIIGISSSIIVFIYELKKHSKTKKSEFSNEKIDDVEQIDEVSAFIFFPKGTPNANRTLDYHENHLHKKIIVNFKTNPHKAYYMQAPDSYGWRLVRKYSDMWVSELHSGSEDEDFTKNWCDKKGFVLIPRSASKDDLLEEN